MPLERQPHILLVEDELIVAKDQSQRLEQEGFSVSVAPSGREAVEQAISGPEFQVVLMDIGLGGGMDGIAAAEEILNHRELPIVFLTAYADPKTLREVSRVTRYGYVLKNSGFPLLLQSIRMASDLFAARRAVGEREARMRSLINASPDIIFLIDAEGRLLEANQRALELFGLQGRNWRGERVEELRHVVSPGLAESFRELAHDGHREAYPRWDATLTDRLGERRTLDVIQAPWSSDYAEKGLIVLARDVSERSVAEQQLREKSLQLQRLSRHIQDTREEQNRYVAREIHDELGQALTTLDILLTLAEDSARDDRKDSIESLGDTLGEAREVLARTSTTVRDLVRELRPAVLDHLGPVEAIKAELEEFEKRSGVTATFENKLTESPALGEKCALALFRIVQEGLTNVSRHANAENVCLTFLREGETLLLSLEDDGRGFDPEEERSVKTFGLLGMEERAEACGGSLEVSSGPGEGATVSVHIPEEPGR